MQFKIVVDKALLRRFYLRCKAITTTLRRVVVHFYLTLGFVRCLFASLSTTARQIVVDRALLRRLKISTKAQTTPNRPVFVESEADSSKVNP
jgi:hypothetical protein